MRNRLVFAHTPDLLSGVMLIDSFRRVGEAAFSTVILISAYSDGSVCDSTVKTVFPAARAVKVPQSSTIPVFGFELYHLYVSLANLLPLTPGMTSLPLSRLTTGMNRFSPTMHLADAVAEAVALMSMPTPVRVVTYISISSGSALSLWE